MQLTKGFTYLAIIHESVGYRTGWIVYQTGMKTWEATLFTNHSGYYADVKHIVSNSIGMMGKLEELSMIDEDVEIRPFISTVLMRKAMFNLLRLGEFDESNS